MHREVQLQALRAAARVEFSVGSFALVSCGGTTIDPAPVPNGTGTATGENTPKDPAKSGGTATGTANPGETRGREPTDPPSTPTTPTTPTTPSKSCEKVIADAFPTEGMYPGKK